MRAFACVRGPSGEEVELGHGDLVGRLTRATLYLDDPRVSEAHALVSLRGDRLKLLALRGPLFLGPADKAVQKTEVDLTDGLVVGLGHGLTLTVEDVFLPDRVLAIEAPGLPRQALQGVVSVFLLPRPRIVSGFSPTADALIWGEGGQWKLSSRGQTSALAPGAQATITPSGEGEPLTITVTEMALGQSAAARTFGGAQPLRLVVSYDTVAIHAGERVTLLSGVTARLLSELVAFDGPCAWEVLAGEVWGSDIERDQLRARFDMAMLRLRKRLRDAALRDELVVTTGTGQVQLVLHSGDVVDARL